MAKLRFNLKNSKSKTETLIFLFLNHDSDRLKMSTGISISPKHWNKKQQRVKELIDVPNHHLINQELEKMSHVMIKELNKHLQKYDYLDKDILKANYNKSLSSSKNTKKQKKNFWSYFEEFIEYKSKQLNDIKDYNNSLRKHIVATEIFINKKATFEDIKKLHGGFVDSMKKYLSENAINSKGTNGLTVNTIGKQFKNLKVFLNWCFDNNYIDRFSIKHIVNTTEDVDAVYLSETEIEKLIQLKLNDETEIRVRDGFVLSCNTALRFGDLSKLRMNHINYKDGKGTISIQQEKTKGKKVQIPINNISKKILKKYDNNSPIGKIKSSIFNSIIKDLCQRAKIDDNIVIYRTEKGNRVEYDYKKYKLVSSHTARRTFCTLKMKNNVPINLIMSVSGHKSHKSFFRYLKMSQTDTAEEMRKYM